jgi:microsomal prostaglandin-E synthase 2
MWRGSFLGLRRGRWSSVGHQLTSNKRPLSSVSASPITFYQYKICPFCNRVKAFLDYNKMAYRAIEVNPISKKEIKFSGFTKVPVATIGDHTMEDSMKIIEYLRDSSSLASNKTKVHELWTEDTEKWVQWSESKLAILLYPNITRTFGDSWKAFQYCDEVKSWSASERILNRYLGPVAMYLVSSKIKKKHGIVDEKSELDALLKEWTNALGTNRFLHGEKITLPDLMVFGVLRGIHELPAFSDLMSRNLPLKQWYQGVESSIGESNRV